jgi:hypothetical protein
MHLTLCRKTLLPVSHSLGQFFTPSPADGTLRYDNDDMYTYKLDELMRVDLCSLPFSFDLPHSDFSRIGFIVVVPSPILVDLEFELRILHPGTISTLGVGFRFP